MPCKYDGNQRHGNQEQLGAVLRVHDACGRNGVGSGARQQEEGGEERVAPELDVRDAVGKVLQVEGEGGDQAGDGQHVDVAPVRTLEQDLVQCLALRQLGLEGVLQEVAANQE